MCFRFGSCFGSGSGQDHGYYNGADHKPADHQPAPNNEAVQNAGGQDYGRPTPNNEAVQNADHKPADHQPAPNNEAVQNAGGATKDHVDDAGGHGGYSPHAQNKADDTLKHPAAWNGKVSDDADYTNTYAARLHEAAAAANPTENAATDHHNYPATTTTTALARY